MQYSYARHFRDADAFYVFGCVGCNLKNRKESFTLNKFILIFDRKMRRIMNTHCRCYWNRFLQRHFLYIPNVKINFKVAMTCTLKNFKLFLICYCVALATKKNQVMLCLVKRNFQ